MTTTRHARSIGVAAALLVLAPALTGCGGKDAAANPPASSSGSPSSSGTDPSTSPSTSVAPAAGKLMDTATASIHAPVGWLVSTPVKDQTVVGQTENGLSAVGLSVVDNYGVSYSLKQAAQLDIRTGTYTGAQILPETEIAGEPAFHVHGKADAVRTYDAYGLEHNGHTVTVIFKIRQSNKDRQQLIDSVLATLALK